jgi:type IV pilus assembly protein PilC
MSGEIKVKEAKKHNSETAVSEKTKQAPVEAKQDEIEESVISKRQIKLKAIGVGAVTFFCRQLSTLVDVGIPLLKCLQILHQRTTNQKLQKVIKHLSGDIEKGTAFSGALEKFPKVFNPFFVNMTKVAEKGGSLDEALKVVADVLEEEELMKQKVKSSLYYPLTTLLVGIVVVLVLVFTIIPWFRRMYGEHNIELPTITKTVLAITNPITLLLIVAAVIALIAFFMWYGKSSGSKVFYDRVKLKIPFFGQRLFMKMHVARFARNFGTLIRGGVPMLQALDVVKETSENTVIAEAVAQTIKHVESGGRLEQPLREADVFPDVVVDMIAIGEEAGKLDLMLFKIAELYDEEVERAINTLPSLIQPILIVILGIVTGVIAAAMFLPYFELVNFSGF